MIPKNTKKIISYLLRNMELLNINQISRNLGVSVGSVFKILKSLENKRVVVCSNLGNAKFYNLNLKNEEARKLSELILLDEKENLSGYSKLYADELQNFAGAEMILLFGSVLKEKKFNDVDVLFLSNKPKEVTKFCLELSQIKTKPIVPLILTKKDLIKEIKDKKEAIKKQTIEELATDKVYKQLGTLKGRDKKDRQGIKEIALPVYLKSKADKKVIKVENWGKILKEIENE